MSNNICKQFKALCPMMYKLYQPYFLWQLPSVLCDMLTVIIAVWYVTRCYLVSKGWHVVCTEWEDLGASELDSCTSSRRVVAGVATVRDSCQGAGDLAIPDDPFPIKGTDIEHCETVVASWKHFRWCSKYSDAERGTYVVLSTASVCHLYYKCWRQRDGRAKVWMGTSGGA